MKPYIICDPQENVLNYDLRFDGVNHWTAPVYEILEGPDAGKVMLKFDINLILCYFLIHFVKIG